MFVLYNPGKGRNEKVMQGVVEGPTKIVIGCTNFCAFVFPLPSNLP